MPLPITLIIDDPAPLINVFWWHAAAAQNTDAPLQASGEPVARAIPLDFLDDFVETVETWGLKGKFSVLPYPAGLGPITQGWPGCNTGQLTAWLDKVRRHLLPHMDITPEILTHARALDLDSGALLPDDERVWARSQTEATLTPYISHALEILNQVGLPATGVTSPWDFGIEVEGEYQRAIRRAMQQVNQRQQSWYFLHQSEALDFQSHIVHQRGDAYLVSLCAQADDIFWQTMENPRTDPAYIAAIADQYLTADGRQGRLAQLLAAGTPIVCLAHWQSLYTNGRRTGLKALTQVGRRLRSTWGNQVEWVTCSQLAGRLAAGQLEGTRIDRSG